MIQKIISGFFLALCAIVGVIGVLGILGSAVESVTDWQIEHDRCLKHAINAYEAKRCR